MCRDYALEVIMLLVHSGEKINLSWTRKLPLILNPYSHLLSYQHSLMLSVCIAAFHIFRGIINSFRFSEIMLRFLKSHLLVKVLFKQQNNCKSPVYR